MRAQCGVWVNVLHASESFLENSQSCGLLHVPGRRKSHDIGQRPRFWVVFLFFTMLAPFTPTSGRKQVSIFGAFFDILGFGPFSILCQTT